MSIWDQFGDRLESQTTNPLFLGGAALLTGEGMTGAMRGMQMGNEFQQQRRKQAEADQQKALWQQYTQGDMGGLTPQMQQLIRAIGPQQGATVAGQYMMKQPELEMDRKKLEAQIPLMQAQAAAARAQAANSGQSDDIREFNFAQKGGFTGTFTDWMKQKRDMGNNASQNITWGQDSNGNWIAMQANRAGELIQSKLPNGVTPIPVPQLAEAKAAATQRGEAAGKAQVDLPGIETRSASMLRALDEAEKAVDMVPRMTGWTGNLPNVTPAARDAQAKIDQVQGKVFLQAFDGLRGAGAITETEGAKASASLSRLQETRVGTPEYKQALADVRREVEALRDLARRKARASAPTPAPSPAAPPASGGWGIRRLD